MIYDKRRERLKKLKPYMVVHHPPTGRSAVYDREYELIFEGASNQLLRFAKNHHTQKKSGFKLTYPEQQPSWMVENIKEECVCYHCYNDGTSNDNIAEIPEG